MAQVVAMRRKQDNAAVPPLFLPAQEGYHTEPAPADRITPTARMGAILKLGSKRRLASGLSVLQGDQLRLTATLMIQLKYRCYRKRKELWMQFYKVNLRYEQAILEGRIKRRRQVFGFVQHLLYMILLAFVLTSQSGGGNSSTADRYELVATISDHINNIEAEGGLQFENLGTLDEFGLWVKTGLLAAENMNFRTTEDGVSQAWFKTYNRMVGSPRIEVVRISDKCPWKVDGWDTGQFAYRLAEDDDKCFPALTTQTQDDGKFGPWYDPERFKSRVAPGGEIVYVLDAGITDLATKRVGDAIDVGFIDPVRTRIVRVRLTTYNGALPMFCSLVIEATLSPTGILRPLFYATAFPVQEYTKGSRFVLFLDLTFLVWTGLQFVKEVCASLRAAGHTRRGFPD